MDCKELDTTECSHTHTHTHTDTYGYLRRSQVEEDDIWYLRFVLFFGQYFPSSKCVFRNPAVMYQTLPMCLASCRVLETQRRGHGLDTTWRRAEAVSHQCQYNMGKHECNSQLLLPQAGSPATHEAFSLQVQSYPAYLAILFIIEEMVQ